MSEELKPCPFCGSRNLKLRTEDWTCRNCGATSYWAYNTRPIEDELNAQIAQLTAERDEWKNKFTDALACNGRLVEQVEQLTAQLAEWKADAERLIQLSNFNNKRAGEYFELHQQLVAKYGTENQVSDAEITGWMK